MKTIAIIACSDTKFAEIDYVCNLIKKFGHTSLVIDPSTSPNFKSKFSIGREQIVQEIGLDWKNLNGGPKHILLEAVKNGCSKLVPRLYQEGKIDAVFSMGGLQNTVVGSAAMRMLPIGIPKVIVSTVACGQRPFSLIAGTKDITMIPAITDLAGLNIISEIVLSNAISAIVGMIEKAGTEIKPSNNSIVGTTLMGATNDGVVKAISYLEQNNIEVMTFHSTGVGGKVMEELIEIGVINATMDLTLHEIVYEYFGKGFGFGTINRLSVGAKKGIPMVICPGGIDFICQWRNDLFSDIEQRKMIWHNSDLAHVKLNEQEITNITEIIISRLNEAKGKVVVVIPTQGLRSFTKKGEALYDPDLDQIIIKLFQTKLKKDIPVKLVDANIMDDKFAKFAAKEMLALLKK